MVGCPDKVKGELQMRLMRISSADRRRRRAAIFSYITQMLDDHKTNLGELGGGADDHARRRGR